MLLDHLQAVEETDLKEVPVRELRGVIAGIVMDAMVFAFSFA